MVTSDEKTKQKNKEISIHTEQLDVFYILIKNELHEHRKQAVFYSIKIKILKGGTASIIIHFYCQLLNNT